MRENHLGKICILARVTQASKPKLENKFPDNYQISLIKFNKIPRYQRGMGAIN